MNLENQSRTLILTKLIGFPYFAEWLRVVSSLKVTIILSGHVENYFRYVGTKIAEKIIENKDGFNNWVMNKSEAPA